MSAGEAAIQHNIMQQQRHIVQQLIVYHPRDLRLRVRGAARDSLFDEARQKARERAKGNDDLESVPSPGPLLGQKVKERDREERASCACWTMVACSYLMRKRLIDTSRMKKQGMKLEKMFVSSFPVKTQKPVWRNCGHLTKMMISRGSGTKAIGMHSRILQEEFLKRSSKARMERVCAAAA